MAPPNEGDGGATAVDLPGSPRKIVPEHQMIIAQCDMYKCSPAGKMGTSFGIELERKTLVYQLLPSSLAGWNQDFTFVIPRN